MRPISHMETIIVFFSLSHLIISIIENYPITPCFTILNTHEKKLEGPLNMLKSRISLHKI